MKTLHKFINENQHRLDESEEVINEAFESSKLQEFFNSSNITGKLLTSAINDLNHIAKVDVQMSKLQDDDFLMHNKQINPSYDGSKLRKAAKDDNYVRMFFNKYGRCIGITSGEFTICGDTVKRDRFEFKTVHGMYDACNSMLTIKTNQLTNASGLNELRNNRMLSKKDAIALKSLSSILSEQKRRYRELVQDMKRNKAVSNNSFAKWLEEDVNKVIEQFNQALSNSYVQQDFDSARYISDNLYDIIRMTESLVDYQTRIKQYEERIENLPADKLAEVSMKTYNDYIIDYQNDMLAKLNQIEKLISKLDYINLEK
jgi:hypothetical protein